jgi:hypothetical protein
VKRKGPKLGSPQGLCSQSRGTCAPSLENEGSGASPDWESVASTKDRKIK